MSKFYAIRKGRKIGIVNTWKECQDSIKGFKGAEFKSFISITDAIEYMSKDISTPTDYIKHEQDLLYVYVDGSYNKEEDIVGFGLVAVLNDKEYYTYFNGFKSHPYNSHRNVFGEVLGSIEGIEYAIRDGFEEVVIIYDYQGVEKWATKEWRANTPMTQTYVNYIDYTKNKINIKFKKVKAHTGNKYNELADKLAKKGAKINA